MPFSTKQSDIFYNDETKEMFVCTVSAITGAKCTGGETIYGALPIVYKIDRETNFKQTVYPDNLATFQTDVNSDLYNLIPSCPVEDLNFDSITKPLINFNKDTSRYAITFLGRFADDVDGLVINNYVFEDVDNKFHLLKAKSLLPQNSLSAANGRFTFDSNYLNSDLYFGGNTVRNQNTSWFNPTDSEEVERSPNYMVAPTFVESTSSIGFNLIQDFSRTEFDALTGDQNFPFLYNGGYITINPKYVAFDPQQTIRVDFRARSFNTATPTAYGSTQSTGTNATRWVQQYAPAGAGEGFCVYFVKQPEYNSYIVPNGVGTTLGYSPADFNQVEVAGSAQTTVGLFRRNNWNPYTHATGRNQGGNVGDGTVADSFLGVGFDIGGNFASTSEDKPGWYNGNSYTATPCSVAIRGNRFTDCKVLSAVELAGVPGATNIPLHTSASNAVFVDYRIDLSNKGNRLTVSHKLTSSTDYNTILDLRLNKIQGTGAGNEYEPWSGFDVDEIEGNYPLLNVGLSFTTSTKASQFELHSFEVKGVKVHKPWEVKEKKETSERIEYINKSSEDLRKRMMNNQIEENVDVEMVVPAKSTFANDLYEDTNTTEVTLCDVNKPDITEDEVEVRYTGIRPESIDRIQQATERGELIPEIGGNPIPRAIGEIDKVYTDKAKRKEIKASEPVVQILPPVGFESACPTALFNSKATVKPELYRSATFTYSPTPQSSIKQYTFFIRGIRTNNKQTNTLTLYRQHIRTIETAWLAEVQKFPDFRYWELHQVDPKTWKSDPQVDYTYPVDNDGNLSTWFWLPITHDDGTAYTDDDINNIYLAEGLVVTGDQPCVVVPESRTEGFVDLDRTPHLTEDDLVENTGGDNVDPKGELSETEGFDLPTTTSSVKPIFDPNKLGNVIRERSIVVSESAEEAYSGYAPAFFTLFDSGWLKVELDDAPIGEDVYYRSPGGTRYKANGINEFNFEDLTGLTDREDYERYVKRQEISSGYILKGGG